MPDYEEVVWTKVREPHPCTIIKDIYTDSEKTCGDPAEMKITFPDDPDNPTYEFKKSGIDIVIAFDLDIY